jgi:hypothetical protein
MSNVEMKETKKLIPDPPYFCGVGRTEKLEAWLKENTPADFAEEYPFMAEAMIQWNLKGGAPSGHENYALKCAIRAFNAGTKFKTPGIDMNDQFLKRQKLERQLGIDRLTPCLDALDN